MFWWIMNNITLSARLKQIASFVQGGTAADIGTDHGYIPVYLRQNGVCPFVIASDINKGPLDSAVQTARKYGVDGIRFVHAPGLDGVSPGEAGTVIIAGMGGETITEILKAAPWVHSGGVRLILQPQSKTEVLSEYLCRCGFGITDISLVRDGGRIYIVLAAEPGEFGAEDMFFLRQLADRRDALLKEYAQGMLQRLLRRRRGLESEEVRNEGELAQTDRAIEELEHTIEECEKWPQ